MGCEMLKRINQGDFVMNRAGIIGMAAAVMLIAGVCQAVEPAYQGALGNNEEPALRPYKWVSQGLLSLVYHTGERIGHGNMKTPILGTVEGLRGLRRGTLKMTENTWNGLLGAPLPKKGSKDYKKLGVLNERLEAETVRRNAGDFAFSWWYFPVLKAVDTFPMETELQVDLRVENARIIRDARKNGTEPKLVSIPDTCPFVGHICREIAKCSEKKEAASEGLCGKRCKKASCGVKAGK